jgi:hypothetical protein
LLADVTDRATWRKVPEATKRKYRARQYEKQGCKLGARTPRRGKKR